MTKFKVELNVEDCIGCGACTAVAADYWKMEGDKSTIIGGKKESGKETKEVSEDEEKMHKEAAESCPVNVISIINLDNNEKII